MSATPSNPSQASTHQASKADQLARTRRNQQRCRERKRAHVTELENQVEALQARIRQCEPCESPNPSEVESALDTARRENAARRDLLHALGFDDEIQDRFIQSKAKRQVIYDIFQQGQDVAALSPQNLRDTQVSAAASNSGLVDFANLELDDAELMPHNGTNANGVGTFMDTHDQHVDGTHMEQWLFSPMTLDKMQPFPTAGFAHDPWLGEPYNDQVPLEQGVPTSVGQNKHQELDLTQESSTKGLTNGTEVTSSAYQTDLLTGRQTIDQCFLDTVVNLTSAEESSTVCSSALSLIFRHNRKGLSMAALQEKLRPGMIAASGASSECRIEDSVLFKVLAEVSGSDTQQEMSILSPS